MKKLDSTLFIPPILLSAFRWIRSAVRDSYRIGDITISIPRHIDLPNIQEKHPLYDRFLPVLSKALNGPKAILDIGANIGDSAVAMAQQCTNPLVCVEPSSRFYPYLIENLKRIPGPARTFVHKKMIGTGKFSGNLDHTKGTARLAMEPGQQAIPSVALDNLEGLPEEVILIKSDTDGFDFDVLLSAKALIQKHHPVLFWENEVHGALQLEGFSRLYEMLAAEGYNSICVFDNYGNLLLEDATIKNLVSLNSYLNSMRNLQQTRTFYYVDILATTPANAASVREAIVAYKALMT